MSETININKLTPALRKYMEKKQEEEKTPLIRYMEKQEERGQLLSSADMQDGEDTFSYLERKQEERKARNERTAQHNKAKDSIDPAQAAETVKSVSFRKLPRQTASQQFINQNDVNGKKVLAVPQNNREALAKNIAESDLESYRKKEAERAAKQKKIDEARPISKVQEDIDDIDKNIKKAKKDAALGEISMLLGNQYPREQATERLSWLEGERERYADELEFSRYAEYEKLRKSEDYEENSQYSTTANAVNHKAVLTQSGVFGGVTGYDDWVYEYINKNPEVLAAERSSAVKGNSGAASAMGYDLQFLQSMNDDEIGTYNYLYRTEGKESAEEYLDYLQSDLYERQRKASEEKYAEFAGRHPVLASAASLASNAVKGAAYIGQAADALINGEADPNAPYNAPVYNTNAVRSAVSAVAEEKWGKAGSFAYGVGMSMADFLAAAGLTGGTGLSMLIMGSGAAADTTLSALDRGVDTNAALVLGAAAGVIEAITEKYSVDALFKGDWDEKSIKYILKNILTEGAEEGASAILNTAADILLSGDKSEWKLSVAAYMDEGYSEKEAFDLTLKDKITELGLDVLGGAISGGLMSGGSVAIDQTGKAAARANEKYSQFETLREAVKQDNARRDFEFTQDGVEQEGFVLPTAADTAKSTEAKVETDLDAGLKEDAAPRAKTYEETVLEKKIAKAATTAERSGLRLGVSEADIKTAKSLGLRTGRNVVFYSDATDAGKKKDGYINHKTNTIYVNKDAGAQKAAAQVLGHELTHSTEGTEAYDLLEQKAFESLIRKGINPDAERERIKQLYKRAGIDLATDEQVDGEIVAKYVEKNLINNRAAVRELVRENPSAARKFKMSLAKMLTRATGKENYIDYKTITSMQKMIDDAAKEEAKAAETEVPVTEAQPVASETAKTEVRTEAPAAETASEKTEVIKTHAEKTPASEAKTEVIKKPSFETAAAEETEQDTKSRAEEPMPSGWDEYLERIVSRYEAGELTEEEYEEAYSAYEEARDTGVPFDKSSIMVEDVEGKIPGAIRKAVEVVTGGAKSAEQMQEVRSYAESGKPVSGTDENMREIAGEIADKVRADEGVQWSVSEDESTAFSKKLADYIDKLYIVNASTSLNGDFIGGDSESEEFAAVNNLITELQNQSGDKIITGYGHKSLVDAAEKIVEEWKNNYDSGNILHRKLDEISENGAEVPSVRLYRGFNKSDKANEENLTKQKSVYDVVGKNDPNKITELAPLSYYTESEEDARNYANMDANTFEEYRQRGVREYRQNIIDGKDMNGISEGEFAEKRAQKMFSILHGSEPSKGRIESFDYIPNKVLDLTELGDVVDYDDIGRVYQILSDAFNIPVAVVEDVLAIGEIIDPDSLKIPTFKLLRNLPGNNFGTRMVELAKEAGYDSFRYNEGGYNHYAVINDDNGIAHGVSPVSTDTSVGSTAEVPSTAEEAPAPPKSLQNVLPTQAMTRLKRAEYAFAESMREMFELSNEDYYIEFLQNVHAISKDVIQNGGDPDAAIGKLFTDFNTATEAAMEAWQYAQFERSAKQFTDQLNVIKRYADSRAKTATPEKAQQNYTAEDAEKMFEARRDAQKNLDRAKARALLTEEDKLVIGQIKRGEISVDQLNPAEYNVEDIRAVAEAEMAFDEADKLVSIYKKQIKAGYHSEAEDALKNIKSWKDKTTFAYMRESIDRNFRDIIPDETEAEAFVKQYIKPVHKAEADKQRALSNYRERVKALNLKEKPAKGEFVSESYAVQLLGEAEDNIRILEKMKKPETKRDGKTLEEWKSAVELLWADNPSLDQTKIRNAVESFRQIYDELLKQMNQVLLENGYPPVRYRSGYFPHFTVGSEDAVMAKFSRLFGIKLEVNPLPTSINGLTQDFKPGKAWFGHALERTGFETTYDAVAGFEQYIGGALDVIYHTRNIQKFRALASQIRWLSADEGIKKQHQDIVNDDTLSEEQQESIIRDLYAKGRYRMSNLVLYLDEYTNRLANKKMRLDRSMEELFGRKFYTVMQNLESRVAANMIGANIGSALTNIIPLNQAGAIIGNRYVLRGLWDTMQNVKDKDGFVAMSDYLVNRRGSVALGRTGMQKFVDATGIPMQFIDDIVSEAVVRAAYYKNLKSGMSEETALEHADEMAASIMADRSKGALPLLFDVKNPVAKLLTQFQVEVNNEFSVIFKDIPKEAKEKGLGMLAWLLFKYFVGAKIFNDFYEKIVGRRPAFDPLEMVNDAVGGLTGYQLPNVLELFEEDAWIAEKMNPADAIAEFGTNAAESIPFVGGVLGGGRVPIQSALPDMNNLLNAVSNNEWSTERRLSTLGKELMKPAAYLLPPAAGGTGKKLLETAAAAARGGVYGVSDTTLDDGTVVGEEALKYPFYTDSAVEFALNFVRSVMGGTSTTSGGVEWVESGFKGITASETKVYKEMLANGETQHKAWDTIRKLKKTSDDIERCNIIAEANLSYGAARALFESKVTATQGDKIKAVTSAGVSFNDFLGLYAEYKRVNALNKDPLVKTAEFDKYVNKHFKSESQRNAITSAFEYSAFKKSVKNYKELINAGIGEDHAFEIASAVDALEPVGEAQNVTSVQKARAVIDAVLDDEDRMTALGVVLSDSDARKYRTAADMGVDADTYTAFREALPSYDADGNGSYTHAEIRSAIDAISGIMSPEQMIMLLMSGQSLPESYTLTNDQKAVMWQLATGSKTAKNNPYSTSAGNKVIEMLYPKE